MFSTSQPENESHPLLVRIRRSEFPSYFGPYTFSGKVGTVHATGEPSAEFRRYDADGHEIERVWLTESGEVLAD